MSHAGFVRSHWKSVFLSPLAAPGVPRLLANLTDTSAAIFMLHRFSVPELSVAGHSPHIVGSILSGLRKRGFHPISLTELFRRLREGEPLRRSVAFTIDDGYFDHAQVGAPVFAEYDWPVTIFAASGFLDGKTWLWWDRISYIFARTRRTTLTAQLGSRRLTYSLESPQARHRHAMALNLLCQDASQQDRLDCIASLAREADVEVPTAPTPEYAPMTWDEARQLERRGATLAPHTVSHPVLSSVTDGESAREIEESWARIRAELRNPTPIFSYPHGRTRDYGRRELETVERLGLLGAVGGHYEKLRPGVHSAPPDLWRVPRCAFHDDLLSVLQYVSGVSSVKMGIRRLIA